jgi:manganese transport protein
VSPPPPPSPADALVLPAPSALERLRARGRVRTTITLLGPAFVAAIAYVDPGNFATNIAGGAQYGYLLLWVILAANLMAMLIQNLSAKVGIATGKNLPELCRERFPRPVSWGLWVQAELIAMATDLAEFIGAAIALNLLFGVPLFVAGLMTGVVAFGILALQQRGYRKFELAIAGLLALILLGFLYDTLSVAHDVSGIARGLPAVVCGHRLDLLATGILGATVMPHVIYLHSALTQDRIPARDDGERRSLMRFGRVDVLIAMGVAGLINMSMLIVAGSLFHGQASGIDSIEGAYNGFEVYAGAGAALAFALALLASGFASSSVGTYSGQVVMQGLHRPNDSAGGAAAGHDGAGPDRPRHRARSLARVDHLAGGAVVRHPVRARTAGAADLQARPDGLAGQSPHHDDHGVGRGGADQRAEPLPALSDLLRLRVRARPDNLRHMGALADRFTEIVDSLPDDWTNLDLDLRIEDEKRYIDAALYLVMVNAQKHTRHPRGSTGASSAPTASGTRPRRRPSTGPEAAGRGRHRRRARASSECARAGRGHPRLGPRRVLPPRVARVRAQ